MEIIFCDNGFSRKEVDYLFQEEFETAKRNGLKCHLISFEDLKRNDLKSSLKSIVQNEKLTKVLYRGWMLKPFEYEEFYKELMTKGYRLINSTKQYRFCHHLPENYNTIQDYTAKSEFLDKSLLNDKEFYHEKLKVFDGQPVIIKDFVKSQKHYWEEACFIPNSNDFHKADSVLDRFLELQGDDLNEGIAIRKFIELEPLTEHSKSKMPLTKEFRLFILNGQIIQSMNYWDEGDYKGVIADTDFLEDIIPNIDSAFFTIDIAKKIDSKWTIIEIGDGQVSGLPDNADINNFYKSIKNAYA